MQFNLSHHCHSFLKPVCTLTLSILLASCASNSNNDAKDTGPIKLNPKVWPKVSSPFDPNESAEIEQKVDALLAQMSLAQKIGQMTQAEISRTTPEDVKKYHLGSVLNGGGGFVNGNKYATVDEWVRTLDAYWSASVDTSDGGLPIPITWGTDAVHGHNKIVGATIFPHNIGLGATRNTELVRKISEITAKQVLATGIDWTFSPALSVVRNDLWGRTYEGYGEDPKLVAEMGKASILGYQGDIRDGTFMNGQRIMATAKHYLADGGTIGGIDRGNNKDDEKTLYEIHGLPYKAALEAGVFSIMASHSSWHGKRMHGEEYLLNTILKERMGFEGFVVGDWNSHGLVEGCSNVTCPASIIAGMDMLMVPFDWKEWIENTIDDVEQGKIPMARIDDAVRRILRAKFRSGLMTAKKPSERPLAGREALLNAPEFQKVARQAVRESLVLLKNNDQTLPIKPNAHVLVAGSAADNLAMQSGGWTISWQSTDLTNKDFPNATSIYQGIKQAVEAAGGTVEFSKSGQYQQKPDVAIVVYGETPYAEWQGDLPHLAFEHKKNTHAKMLEQLQSDGITTVGVLVSGRPLWVNRALNASDAYVAAWLPGSEGAGVADVLFADQSGNARFDFSGTLPYSWPAAPNQAEVNVGDKDYEPLFPFGYGLNYKTASKPLGELPTDAYLASIKGSDDVLLFDGRALDPWEIQIQSGTNYVRYVSGIAHNGPVTVTEADQNTQGDAMNILWRGGSMAGVELVNPNANRNFTNILDQNGALVFDMKLLKPSNQTIYAEMACRGGSCIKAAQVDITTIINASPLNDWNSISVSLNCFAEQGVGFEEIARAFGIKTSGSAELQVTNIQLQPGMGDKAGVQCQ